MKHAPYYIENSFRSDSETGWYVTILNYLRCTMNSQDAHSQDSFSRSAKSINDSSTDLCVGWWCLDDTDLTPVKLSILYTYTIPPTALAEILHRSLWWATPQSLSRVSVVHRNHSVRHGFESYLPARPGRSMAQLHLNPDRALTCMFNKKPSCR